MYLYYDGISLGHVLTNHSMSVDDMINSLGINLDTLASQLNIDDIDFDLFSIGY